MLDITLNTTRADRIGAYGDRNGRTPNLDELAREGVLFERAEAVAPLTLPAHCRLFTGRLPFEHGVRDNGWRLPSREITLARSSIARSAVCSMRSIALVSRSAR